MENDNNEFPDSLNGTDEGTEQILEGESAEEKAARLEEANVKLFSRLKIAQGYVKDADGSWVKKAKPTATQNFNNPAPKTFGIEDEVLDLRLEGYSKTDVEFIMRNGGRKSLEDKNSLTYIAIQNKKEQERAENAASKTVDTSSMSEVERKYTPEQLKNMSAKELEAILPRA